MKLRPDLVEEYNDLKRSSVGMNKNAYREKKSNWIEPLLRKYREAMEKV